jgi:hypothetical protein
LPPKNVIEHLTNKKIGHPSNARIPQEADAQISHLWYNMGETNNWIQYTFGGEDFFLKVNPNLWAWHLVLSIAQDQ